MVRKNCRTYTEAMHRYFGKDAAPLFASKALCVKSIYPVVQSEGMCVDTVSPGEIYTALAAGFSPEKMFFHGTNKTDIPRGMDVLSELALVNAMTEKSRNG